MTQKKIIPRVQRARKSKVKKRKRHIHMDFIMTLYIQGYSFRDIEVGLKERHEFKLSHQQVSNNIKKELLEWKERNQELIDQQKMIDLAKLNKAENECWKAWFKSQEEQIETIEKTIGKLANVAIIEETFKKKVTPGAVGYMQLILKCIEERCKILGNYAPIKADVRKVIKVIPSD